MQYRSSFTRGLVVALGFATVPVATQSLPHLYPRSKIAEAYMLEPYPESSKLAANCISPASDGMLYWLYDIEDVRQSKKQSAPSFPVNEIATDTNGMPIIVQMPDMQGHLDQFDTDTTDVKYAEPRKKIIAKPDTRYFADAYCIEKDGSFMYIVWDGDNLANIAHEQGMTFGRLWFKNPELWDRAPKYAIQPGEKIRITYDWPEKTETHISQGWGGSCVF